MVFRVAQVEAPVHTLWHDIRHAARLLAKSPGYTAVALLTLALGIGINTTIFSFSMPFLLPQLPFADPDRVVMIWTANPARGWNKTLASWPDVEDWKTRNRTLTDLAASVPVTHAATDLDGAPVAVQRVTANYFSVLGVKPAVGRSFAAAEDRAGADNVAFISHRYWQRRFGGSADAINQTVRLDGQPYTIIGVAPQGFWFPTVIDIWVPLVIDAARAPRERRLLLVVGRLQPGAEIAHARTDLSAIASALDEQYPDTNGGWEVRPVTVSEEILDNNTGLLLAFLSLAVGFVLLIACINVANLSMARAQVRERELTIRTMLGAGRRRLIRQLFTESVLLSLAGGALGLLFAYWGMTTLVALNVTKFPVLALFGVDRYAALFTLVVSVVSAVLIGLLPAVKASRLDLNNTIKEGGAAVGGGTKFNRFARGLVIAEIALALPLLLLAALSIRTIVALQRIDWGFATDRILTMRVTLPEDRYAEHRLPEAYAALIAGIQRVAGVESVAVTSALPAIAGRGSTTTTLTIEGSPIVAPRDRPWAIQLAVTEDYFRTMRIPLLRGRTIADGDAAGSLPVAVISRSMERRYWPNSDPVGQRIQAGRATAPNAWVTIVGVVDDVRADNRRGAPSPDLYVPATQRPLHDVALIASTSMDPLNLASAVRTAIWQVDRDLSLRDVNSLDRIIEAGLGPTPIFASIMIVFAVAALMLTVIGLYGVVSFTVSRRTQEIGIRMALGAARRDVLNLVLRQAMRLAMIGMAIGLVLAYGVSRALSSALYGIGVNATDLAVFLAVGAVLAAWTVVASYLPARRASLVDPLKALRYD